MIDNNHTRRFDRINRIITSTGYYLYREKHTRTSHITGLQSSHGITYRITFILGNHLQKSNKHARTSHIK